MNFLKNESYLEYVLDISSIPVKFKFFVMAILLMIILNSDDYFTSGLTQYDHVHLYRTYDVIDIIREGDYTFIS